MADGSGTHLHPLARSTRTPARTLFLGNRNSRHIDDLQQHSKWFRVNKLTLADVFDSFISMIREQTLRARNKLVSKPPITGELLRGNLLERTVWHREGVPEVCAAKVIGFSC